MNRINDLVNLYNGTESFRISIKLNNVTDCVSSFVAIELFADIYAKRH